MWDIDTLDCVRVLEGHNEAVLALAVGPSFLVSGSYDTTVRFWALESLRCVRCAPRCMCPQSMQLPSMHALVVQHHRALLGAQVPALRQARFHPCPVCMQPPCMPALPETLACDARLRAGERSVWYQG